MSAAEVEIPDRQVEAIARAWMLHQGYTAQEISAGEDDRDHSLCELVAGEGWDCTNEDGSDRHPESAGLDEACAMANVALEALATLTPAAQEQDVERVASAIFAADASHNGIEADWARVCAGGLVQHHIDVYRAMARAALAAMTRTPRTVETVIERAFERICVDQPLSGISRADIRKWVELLSDAGLHPTPTPDVIVCECRCHTLANSGEQLVFHNWAGCPCNEPSIDVIAQVRAQCDESAALSDGSCILAYQILTILDAKAGEVRDYRALIDEYLPRILNGLTIGASEAHRKDRDERTPEETALAMALSAAHCLAKDSAGRTHPSELDDTDVESIVDLLRENKRLRAKAGE